MLKINQISIKIKIKFRMACEPEHVRHSAAAAAYL